MRGKINFINLFIRYSILILMGMSNNLLFYMLFTPLTIYPVYFLLKIFFNVSLMSNILFINNLSIGIIDSCIAGSAYYLLLILNLSTPNIKLKKRISLLLFSFFSLLIINIIRIFSLSIIFVFGFSFFDITHKLFWYIGSIFFVILIWFGLLRLFKIKEIPFYSDIISLLNYSRKKIKKTKSSKKN